MRPNISHRQTNGLKRPNCGRSASEAIVALNMARAGLTLHSSSTLLRLRITDSWIALVRIDALAPVVHVTIFSFLRAAFLLRKFVQNLAVLSPIGQLWPVFLRRELVVWIYPRILVFLQVASLICILTSIEVDRFAWIFTVMYKTWVGSIHWLAAAWEHRTFNLFSGSNDTNDSGHIQIIHLSYIN